MLMHLSIHHYALVEHLDLELDQGMTVITGETGAGKSIMLDALGLALGDRADSSAVRPGAGKADILATFDISQIPEAHNWLQERDLDNETQCILRRVITAEGRSRGYINGTPCPLSDLKALGELLIDIHGQHEHQSLLKPETHCRLFDEYTGCQQLSQDVAALARQWKQLQQRLQKHLNNDEEQRARQQLLNYQLEELDNLSLGETELEQLEQEQRTLANAENLLSVCHQAVELCAEQDAGNVLFLLNSCLQRLGNLVSPPNVLNDARELLSAAQIQIEEAVGELNRFIDHFDVDPDHQQQVEARLDAIYTLARKHRVQPAELPALHQRLFDELETCQANDQFIAQLSETLEQCFQQYTQQAARLSEIRHQAASSLVSAIETEMQRLGMPGGRFQVELKPSTQNEPHAAGNEQIEFLVSANPGQPVKPLSKVASGGELSRISLAIQVITAQTSRTPTLVFDEVDVGIGGPTAEIVGQLLRQLGKAGQILTVTHLPQVAALGHHHLYVYKQNDDQATHSDVRRLNQRQRIEEIARMLGGVDMTRESLAHAEKLIELAKRP